MADLPGDRGRPALRVHLLGGFQVSRGDKVVEAGAWKLRKGKNLLKLLALASNHRLHREQAMELLWPEIEPEYAANSLHQALFAARRALASAGGAGQDAPQEILRIEENVLLLDPPGGLWIDAEAFQQAAARARRSQEAADYRAALDLYPGELLPEDRYEDWASSRREVLENEHSALLLDFARLMTERGEIPAALTLYRQVLDKDPAHEEAVRNLMRLYVRAGQRQEALRQYSALEETLRRELDTAPEPESARLYAEIRSGSYATADAPLIAAPKVAAPQPAAPQVAAPARSHNLPSPLSTFIGREAEIEQVRDLLEQARLVTLTGPGGVGKTRLSLRVAHEVLGTFVRDAWLVELAPLGDAALVLQAVAALFEVREDRFRPLERALADYLSTRQVLLVLDNCEHLVEACARLAEGLLRAASGLRILATSREALGVEGEAVFPLQPLAVPDPQRLPLAADLPQFDAVRLFVDRARKVQPGFTLNSQTAAGVAQVCARLDGIPLALELAASRLSVLSIDQIAARLDDRFKLLTGGSRTALPRQRTLQASIDWSYELLSEPERVLLRRLSVFAGGWTLEAAEWVAGERLQEPARLAAQEQGFERTPPSTSNLQPEMVLDLLTQLVNKSLAGADHPAGRPARYHLLETVRQYAQEKLDEAGEAGALGDRHLAYCLHFARQYAPLAITHRYKEIMPLFREEFDNLRRALGWAFAGGPVDRVRQGLWLVLALENIWSLLTFQAEAFSWAQRGLALLEAGGEEEKDRSLRAWALLISGQGAQDFRSAREFFEENLALFRRAGDKNGQVWSLVALANSLRLVDPALAYRYAEEAIALSQEIGDMLALAFAENWKGVVLIGKDNPRAQESLEKALSLLKETDNFVFLQLPITDLGNLAILKGDAEAAQQYFQQALDFSLELEDQYWIANSLGVLGIVAYLRQDFEAMASYTQDSLRRFRAQDNRGSMAWMLRHGAIATRQLGDLRQARQNYREAQAVSQGIRDDYGVFASLAGLGGIAAAEGEWLKAARLLGAAESLFELFTKPLDRVEQLEFERDAALLRGQIDPEALQAAWEEGRQMTLEQALKAAQA